ncbi:MAG TPA: ABC transporter substrate-binding protein, partial [Prosthecobacter sp.]
MRHPTSVSHLPSSWPAAILSLLLAVFVVSCEKTDDRFPPYDNTAEVEAFWKSKPDLFQWKTPADIPADLKWESGADVPEFGDPAAKKGGVYHDFHPTFPATYRVVGPDASGTFRGEHHDQVMMWMAFRHPDADAWVPSIADQWAYSADKKKIYFRMDPKASFSDGTPITVEDFFMTFFIMLSPHIQDPWYNDYYFKEFESITKYDEHTFSYTLKETYPDPMWIVADVQPMSRKFYKEFGPDFPARYQWRKAPSTGAYDFDPETDVTRGRRITLNRVKNWWAKDKKHFRYIYNVDKMDYRIIASQDKAFEDFRQGKLDFFVGGLPRYWYDKAEIPEVYKGYIERHVFFNEFPQVSWAIRLNESKPPLDNQDVRIGINYAMNLQKVLEVDFRGDKTRMNTTESGFGRYTNPNIKARPFDPVKAREHFAAAGYTKSGPDGILMNAAGRRLSLTL